MSKGDWKDGSQNLKGMYFFLNGDINEGDFISANQNGKGNFFGNGNMSKVDWKDGSQNGKGIYFFFFNGDINE